MGFFSKVFKGVKKVFKKIGQGVKKVAMKVGKFMDKIGIVGQIAMSFILPGIGGLLARGIQGLGTLGASMGGMLGKVLSGAAKFAGTVGRTFSSVTSGIKSFLGESAKFIGSKLGMNIPSAATNFFGADGVLGRATEAGMKQWNEGIFAQAIDAIDTAWTSGTGVDPLASAAPGADPFAAPDYGVDAIEGEVVDSSLLGDTQQKISAESLYGKETVSQMLPTIEDTTVTQMTQTQELVDNRNFFQKAGSSLMEQAVADPIGTISRGISVAQQAQGLDYQPTEYSPQGVVYNMNEFASSTRVQGIQDSSSGIGVNGYGYLQSVIDNSYNSYRAPQWQDFMRSSSFS